MIITYETVRELRKNIAYGGNANIASRTLQPHQLDEKISEFTKNKTSERTPCFVMH